MLNSQSCFGTTSWASGQERQVFTKRLSDPRTISEKRSQTSRSVALTYVVSKDLDTLRNLIFISEASAWHQKFYVVSKLLTLAQDVVPKQLWLFNIGRAWESTMNEEPPAFMRGELQCRGCQQNCESACPQGIAIADIMRYSMYYKHYGDLNRAKALYQNTDTARTFANCTLCGVCDEKCNFAIPVMDKLREAHTLMA